MPNINIDEFSSLLTFMYTGYLDLNLGNIYNILLATHILHMPKALEICRNFLMQSQPLDPGRHTNIIKPIASRKAILPHQQIYPPIFSNLQKSEETPFRSIKAEQAQSQALHSVPTLLHRDNVTAGSSKTPDDVIVVHHVPQDSASSGKKTPNSVIVRGNKIAPEKVVGTVKPPKKASSEKVIIDIACCDGPVRFYRVVNKNYGLTNVPSEQPYQREEVNRNEAINKVMNENIRDKQISDENQQNGSSNEVFTCLYCNHTFKSQYCYQKHARRHLNPVSLDSKVQKVETSVSVKREVKLLDMNVQYYPCKTCGSKFPSYYFVHKHRKMCHAEEMADSTNKNNEIVPEGQVESNNGQHGSENSAIDVEIDVNQ